MKMTSMNITGQLPVSQLVNDKPPSSKRNDLFEYSTIRGKRMNSFGGFRIVENNTWYLIIKRGGAIHAIARSFEEAESVMRTQFYNAIDKNNAANNCRFE